MNNHHHDLLAAFNHRVGARLLLAALLCLTPHAHADIVADGGTNILSGAHSNLVGNLSVGSNVSFTLLVLTNGTQVTNSGSVTVGVTSTSDSNRVSLTGAGTRWVVASNFTLGSAGAFNQLVISNGAFLSDSNGIIGNSASADNNVVWVTGANSLWTNSGALDLGVSGGGNRLIVSNGADVFAQDMSVGIGSSTSNEVTVNGSGSRLVVADALTLGNIGDKNLLLVTNSGTVSAGGSLIVGANVLSAGNRVIVDGGFLTVTNAAGTAIYDLRRGTNTLNAGLLNVDQLVMTNSAGVFEFNSGTLITRGGLIDNGTNFVVGAGGSGSSASWDVRNGASNMVIASNLVIGGSLANARLLITNGQALSVLGLDGAIVGDTAAATNSSATVAGAGSVWTNSGALTVGNSASFNTLLISNGGRVVNDYGYVGHNASAANNSVIVTGTGSLWSNRYDLVIGSNGSFNTLLVTNGGRVVNDFGYVGSKASAANNSVIVTGTGSLWSNRYDLVIGSNGSFNTLLVTNGGRVVNDFGIIGDNFSADNNQVTVTGNNSVWTNSDSLFVGFFGSSNTLLISNGGRVENNGAYIGYQFGASNNSVTVTGTNSVWTNRGDLLVGGFGSFNTVLITNGGRVQNNGGVIGQNSGGSNNQVTVTGNNSLWANESGLYVGLSGSFNTLLITNGGRVVSSSGNIGFNSFVSSNNLVTVTGTNSLWTNESFLYVGNGGSFNTLLITNSGTVQATKAVVGNVVVSASNLLTVGKATLTVTNATSDAALDVRRGSAVFNGGAITADQLLLTNGASGIFTFNGGTLITRGAVISNGADFVVGTTGTTPATWDVRAGSSNHFVDGDVRIGNSASFNQLLVTNGALLTNSGEGVLGYNAGANSNTATLAGAGTRWFMSNNLLIGRSGSFSRLVISNGAVVGDNFGILANQATSSNNEALVTGAGSFWSNRVDLRVGDNGAGNRLVISNGGLVGNQTGFIGRISTSSNNEVVVTGAGSFWSNRGDLFVANQGSGNRLLISNSGTVFAGTNVYVGFNSVSSNNLLLLSGGALLTNGGDGVIGANSGANSNTAIISGANGRWLLGGDLYVGSNGAFNTLLITNGGTVANSGGVIGNTSGANGNQVTVTGANSLWSNSGDLEVGQFGSLNSVLIANGASVSNGFGYVGETSAANSNAVTVTGFNSVWNNAGHVLVGYQGSFNTLLITNGGRVTNVLGVLGNDSTASNNRVTVTGINSLWNNSTLFVGYGGSFSTLLITNGGEVRTSDAVVGVDATSTNNLLSVGNGTLTVTNPAGTGIYELRRGTNVLNAGLIDVDNLVMTNTNGFFTFNDGTLITRRATISNGAPFVVGASGSTSATWDVRSNASSSLAAHGLYIGTYNTTNAQLLITNGAFLDTPQLFIGQLGGLSNRATVAGPDSRLRVATSLELNGALGSLLVSNGALVQAASLLTGNTGVGDSNRVEVTGTGSRLLLSGQLTLNDGYGELVVRQGGLVSNATALVGQTVGGYFNSVEVSDPGSRWLTEGTLTIAAGGRYGSLTVSNGGTAKAGGLILSTNSTGSNALVTVALGGTLLVTNATTNAVVNVGVNHHATLDLQGGNATLDRLIATNNTATLTNSELRLSYGTLETRGGATVGGLHELRVGRTAGQAATWIVSGGTNLITPTNIVLGFLNNTTGHVAVAGASTVWSNTGTLDVRRGSLTLNGGSFTTGTLLATNGAQSVVNHNGAALSVSNTIVNNGQVYVLGNTNQAASFNLLGNGTHSFANGLRIASNATLRGSGTIIGSVTNLGTISPGASPGAITINGDLRLTVPSLMSFELGGLIPTNQYDQLTVTSFAELAGNLSLSLLPGYLPNPQDSFTLLKFGSFSGGFANAPGLGRVSLTNNLASFAVTYTLTNFSIGGVRYVDTDGDGQGDLQEQAAGTDPNSSASEMQIVSLLRQGEGPVTVRFTVQTGKNYRIEYSNDLITWSQLSSPASFTAGPPGTKEWIDDGSQTGGLNFLITRRFYRVGLQ